MFDTIRHIAKNDLLDNKKLAETLIVVINEVQLIAKEVQKLRVDADELIENNK